MEPPRLQVPMLLSPHCTHQTEMSIQRDLEKATQEPTNRYYPLCQKSVHVRPAHFNMKKNKDSVLLHYHKARAWNIDPIFHTAYHIPELQKSLPVKNFVRPNFYTKPPDLYMFIGVVGQVENITYCLIFLPFTQGWKRVLCQIFVVIFKHFTF